MSENRVKVEGSSSLYKDLSTGVIINTNEDEIIQARERKKSRLARKAEEQELKNEVSDLKSEISELKELIKQMVK
jgi:hypothetical protein